MPSGQERESGRRRMLRQTALGAAGIAGSAVTSRFIPAAEAQAAGSDTPRRPNVIIFHTDDQDFNTIACYGNDLLTPHTDCLANTGVLFTRGYTTTGVCMASRYALITGQYPSRCTHPSFQKSFPRTVPTEPSFNTPLTVGQHTIASVLKNAGYTTGFVGKWNIGEEYVDPSKRKKLPVSNVWANAWKETNDIDPSNPEISSALAYNQSLEREGISRFGFDYAECIMTNPEGYSCRSLNYHNPEWVTDGALKFINQSKSKPFFLYLNHTLHHIPHPQESLFNADPRTTVGGYLDKAPNVMPDRRAIYDRVIREGFRPETAYCTWMDEALGAILKRLAELGLSDDTMIMFISDNNVPDKGTVYEGGVRVPCIIRYPRRVPAGRRTEALAENIDFAATIFDACGVNPPSGMRLDGKSLMPLLTGERERIHDEIFCEIGWTRAVCTEQYKYLALRYPPSAEEFRTSKKGVAQWLYHCRALEPHQHHALLWHPAFYYPDQLYDVTVDPKEVVNLSLKREYSNTLTDLKGRMTSWLRTFDNPFGEFVS